MNNSSELNTLLIATTVFAIGGLGLFMYNSDKTANDDDDEYLDNDDGSDDTGSDFSVGEEDMDTTLYEEEEDLPKKPKRGQTKRASSNRNAKTKKNNR